MLTLLPRAAECRSPPEDAALSLAAERCPTMLVKAAALALPNDSILTIIAQTLFDKLCCKKSEMKR